ncbi:uncharacterized protein BDW70DRAFT_94727 [Aspergillus foveolatus]|uniref:uncharacterized protein n=1 Tax=Aspergillus foveolatus TaxID=210207 RepID=UPI003CCCC112
MSTSDSNLPDFEHFYSDSSTDSSSSHSFPTAVIVLLPLITGVVLMTGIWCFAVKRGARNRARTLAKEQEQQSSSRGNGAEAGETLIHMQQIPPVVVRPGERHAGVGDGVGNEVEDAPPPYSVAVQSADRSR